MNIGSDPGRSGPGSTFLEFIPTFGQLKTKGLERERLFAGRTQKLE